MFVASGIQREIRMRHLWPVLLFNIFPHYLIKGIIFEKKKVIKHEMSVLIYSTTFVSSSSHSKKN